MLGISIRRSDNKNAQEAQNLINTEEFVAFLSLVSGQGIDEILAKARASADELKSKGTSLANLAADTRKEAEEAYAEAVRIANQQRERSLANARGIEDQARLVLSTVANANSLMAKLGNTPTSIKTLKP